MYVLTNKDESNILAQVKTQALSECHDLLQVYAECCQSSFLSSVWKCRTPLNQLNSCLKPLTSQENMDIARVNYIRERHPSISHNG
ncbi:hypothetical protein HMI54_007233 [Coelomomyces lativittatus]|nr:hypothetical protein HMI54_007233 [Coelomomyces lativittatus]